MSRMGTHGRTAFKLPVRGRTTGNGMKRGRKGINRKFHARQRGSGR